MPEQTSRPPGPQQAFAARLRRLRVENGKPTEVELARRMNCGRTTVSDLLAGRRFPTWEQVQALVRACLGADESAPVGPGWRAGWLATSSELDRLQFGEAAPAQGTDTMEAFARERTATSMVQATWYQDNPEFYSAGAEQVRQARSEIRVTYIRRHPPTVFITPASAEYFAAILDWARGHGGSQRQVRRIIGVPTRDGIADRAMLDWVSRHYAETSEILSYEARILPWNTAGDGLNMALIDERTAFLAFSDGGRQKLNGFSVQDPTFTGYFIRYFEQLWFGLERVEDYLEARN